MLYHNTETGEYGKTLNQLRGMFPYASIPNEAEEVNGWVAYQPTSYNYKEYYRIEEDTPKDGFQVWKQVPIDDKNYIVKDCYTKIDDACSEAVKDFYRFRSSYETREREAQEYRDANYQGEAGSLLASFANSAGLDYKHAALVVLNQSKILRKADEDIEALRMLKYTLKPTLSIEELVALRDKIIADINIIGKELR